MNILKMATKGLAGLTFIALLAVNVQVGSIADSMSQQTAKASLCPAGAQICDWIQYPGQPPLPEPGHAIVITPGKHLDSEAD